MSSDQQFRSWHGEEWVPGYHLNHCTWSIRTHIYASVHKRLNFESSSARPWLSPLGKDTQNAIDDNPAVNDAPQLLPGAHFTKGLRAHNPNVCKFFLLLISTLMIQSDHNFAHVTTAQLSWHIYAKLWPGLMIVFKVSATSIWQDLDYELKNSWWNNFIAIHQGSCAAICRQRELSHRD